MIKINKCSICGCLESETSNFYHHSKYGDNLCNKHYIQLGRHGKTMNKTLKDLNEIVICEDYAEIILYNIKNEEIARAIIDLEDVEKCEKYKWGLNHKYVTTNKTNLHSNFLLHRLIMNPKDNEVVDHINHNELDNRKFNLRICTQNKNAQNTSKSINNTSGIIGISWDKTRNKWSTYIIINYKKIHLGYRSNKEEAIKLRLEAELKYFGKDFAPQREMFKQYGIGGDLN